MRFGRRWVGYAGPERCMRCAAVGVRIRWKDVWGLRPVYCSFDDQRPTRLMTIMFTNAAFDDIYSILPSQRKKANSCSCRFSVWRECHHPLNLTKQIWDDHKLNETGNFFRLDPINFSISSKQVCSNIYWRRPVFPSCNNVVWIVIFLIFNL